MTRQQNRNIVRHPALGETIVYRAAGRSRQILARARTHSAANVAASILLGRNTDATAASRTAGTQRWSAAWTGDDLLLATTPSEADCIDHTGASCPKLAEARERQALAERGLLEINHRTANILQTLASRLERHRRAQNDPVTKLELGTLVASVQASARLQRHLLPPRTHTHVDLGACLRDLAAAIASVTGLQCDVAADPVSVSSQVATHLAAAVNELAWNAHKHAYDGVEGGAIQIACRRDADARLLVSVADHGRGLPLEFDPRVKNGLGLQVVCGVVKRFGGKLLVHSNGGARFTLVLDIPPA